VSDPDPANPPDPATPTQPEPPADSVPETPPDTGPPSGRIALRFLTSDPPTRGSVTDRPKPGNPRTKPIVIRKYPAVTDHRVDGKATEQERLSIIRRKEVRAIDSPGPELERALRDKDPAVRRAALANGHTSRDQRLASLVADDSGPVRRWAWQCLAAAEGHREQSASALVAALADGEWAVRTITWPAAEDQTCRDRSDQQMWLFSAHPRGGKRLVGVPAPGGAADDVPFVMLTDCHDVAGCVAARWSPTAKIGIPDPQAGDSPQVRLFLAGSAMVPGELVGRYGIGDPDPQVRAAAVGNPRFPTILVAQAARDGDARECRRVAASAPLCWAAVESLAQHPDRAVREALADRRNMPPEIQTVLARCAGDQLRQRLARNETLHSAAFPVLLEHGAPAVRLELVKRPDLTDAALKLLHKDPDPRVREQVGRRLMELLAGEDAA